MVHGAWKWLEVAGSGFLHSINNVSHTPHRGEATNDLQELLLEEHILDFFLLFSWNQESGDYAQEQLSIRM